MRGGIALFLGIHLSMAAPACGDEFLGKLPTTGGWARYHVITKKDSGEETVNKEKFKSLTATLKDDVRCRWLEYESWSTDGEQHPPVKFLIPEKTIQSTATPSDEILVYLQHDRRGQICSVPPVNQGWLPTAYLYFPGFLKDAKTVPDARTVKHQTGSLEIPSAQVGTYKWSRNKQNPEAAVFETKYRVWLHPDMPIGFALAQIQFAIYNGERKVRTWDFEYALEEFGENAKAAIEEESAAPLQP